MQHLLAKDVRLFTPYLWLIVPVHVLWCAQAFLAPEMYFWMSLAAALAWTGGVLAIEWRMDTDRFVASLPVTRGTTVRARYASAFAGVALGAVLFVIYGYAIAAIAPARIVASWGSSPSWASVDGVAAFVLVGYVLLVVFLPFYFRFGLAYGACWFGLSLTLLLVLATSLARLLGSVDRAAIRPPPSTMAREWLAALATSWGVPLAGLALAVGALALGAFSVWLSVRFYEERDL